MGWGLVELPWSHSRECRAHEHRITAQLLMTVTCVVSAERVSRTTRPVFSTCFVVSMRMRAIVYRLCSKGLIVPAFVRRSVGAEWSWRAVC